MGDTDLGAGAVPRLLDIAGFSFDGNVTIRFPDCAELNESSPLHCLT